MIAGPSEPAFAMHATTDLCDAHADLQVCEPLFGDFGGQLAFGGRAKTLKVFEDNQRVRELLETPGEGRVLVVDGGGSPRCALVGGNLGVLAENNGWAGLLVYGYVRDTEELAGCAVGIKALGTFPRKSEKGLHTPHEDRVLDFANVRIGPDSWVYADIDGVVIADREL